MLVLLCNVARSRLKKKKKKKKKKRKKEEEEEEEEEAIPWLMRKMAMSDLIL